MRLRPTTTLPPLPPDAPSLEPSVVRALKRLDPTIRLHFSHHALSPLDATPIIATDTGEPLSRACWSIWNADPEGALWRICELIDKKGNYVPVDWRIVDTLAQDPTHLYGPEEAFRRKKDMQEEKKQKGIKQAAENKVDIVKANKGKIRELMADPFRRADPTTIDQGWEKPETLSI